MRLEWDRTGERLYETGTRRGVIYPQASDGTYEKGAAWNGLTSVTKSPSGAEPNKIYADDINYLTLMSAEELGGTIEAYTYPDEFKRCNGEAQPVKGLSLGMQTRQAFGFSYRTILGNDTVGDDYAYKLHLIYNAKASPSEKQHQTVNDSPEAVTMSWEFSTTPVVVNAVDPVTGKVYKPSSSIEIDSSMFSDEKMAAFEDILYGTEDEDAKLPTIDEVIEFFAGDDNVLSGLKVTAYNGDMDLFGKTAADLQSNVVVGANAITGTLKYQANYTGFSSKTEEQTGNFIAIKADVPAATDAKITVKVTNPVVLDDDKIIVLRIADKDTQTITVTASKEGYDDVVKVYGLTGLVCETA